MGAQITHLGKTVLQIRKITNTNTNQTLQRMGAQITHFGKATLVLASMLADNNLAIQAQGSLANKYSTG